MGHQLGAANLRMLHELVMQIHGETSKRQVKNARVGIAENSGAGEVCAVIILKR